MGSSFWPIKKGDRVWITVRKNRWVESPMVRVKGTVLRLIHYRSNGGRPPSVRVEPDTWDGRTCTRQMNEVEKLGLLDTLADGAP